jgi:hypothetical protein
VEELVRTWLPVATVLLGAWAAWRYRTYEKLLEAYGEWAAAMHRDIYEQALSDRGERWLDTVAEAAGELLAGRAKLLLLERESHLRRIVILLSDMNQLGTDAFERAGLTAPNGMWAGNFFYWRKQQRLDAFVEALAEAGYWGRDNVKLVESVWQQNPMPKAAPR